MKNYAFFIALFVCLSCSKSLEIPEEETCKVEFRLQLSPEILPFPTTKAMPGGDPDEPSLSTPNGLFNRLEYTLYIDEHPAAIKSLSLDPSYEDFGQYMYEELPRGRYKASFLAHSAGSAERNQNIVTFPLMKDVFFKQITFEMDGKTDIAKEVQLDRMVSRVEFVATDAVPDSVVRLLINAKQIYNAFDLFTGVATEDFMLYNKEHLLSKLEKQNKSGNKHTFYTFVPAGKTIEEASLIALTQNNDTTRHRQVSHIPIAINRLIRYTGSLYSPDISGATFDLSITDNGAWADSTDIILE